MDTISIILELLNDSGKNQKELTEYIGITEAVFSQWKSKSSKSYNKYLDKIAEYFDVSTDYLLGKTDIKKEPPKSERLIELLKDPFAKQVYDKYIKLNQSGKEQFEKYLDFLLSTQDKK